MSLTVRVLVGLVAGFGVGILSTHVGAIAALPAWVEPAGTLFINAIRMTVIPLVVSSLITGVGAARDPRVVGRLGARALLWFLGILLASAAVGVLAAPPAL